MYSTSVDSTVAVPLKYIEFGGAGGGGDDDDSVQNTPVILMHGLLGSKRNFSSIGTALSRQLKKKRRVFAVDLRNHGDNDASNWKSSMSYGDMADDLLHFLDLNGMEKAVLVAHSMGGKGEVIFNCNIVRLFVCALLQSYVFSSCTSLFFVISREGGWVGCVGYCTCSI